MKRQLLSLFLFSSLAAIPLARCAAAELFVSPDGDDANTGDSWATALATPQAAVTKAASGDTITLASGTYTVGYHVTIDKTLAIRGANSAFDTIVSGGGAGQRRVFAVAAGGDATFEDLTIADGYASDENHFGGGVRLQGSDADHHARATFRRCILTRNISRDRGAAVWAGPYSRATLENCLVAGNSSWNYAVLSTERNDARMTLRNCTVTRNDQSNAGAGILVSHGSALEVLNSIVVDNRSSTGVANFADWGGGLTFSNCCVTPQPSSAANCCSIPPNS